MALIEMIPVCRWEPFPAQIPRGEKLLEMVLFLIQCFCLSRNEQVVLGTPGLFLLGREKTVSSFLPLILDKN